LSARSLSLLAAENLVARPVGWLVGQLFSLIRAVPEVIVALLFVPIFGLSPMAGVLAIGIHSIGSLGKLLYEIIEGIDRGPIEAADAVGAGRLQRLRWAVVPQVAPELTSFVLYRFEINLRSAAVLGMVGAGGIGAPLIQRLSFRRWDEVSMFLIVIIAFVVIVDALSSRIRRRLV